MIWGKVLLVHNLSWSLMLQILQMIQRAVRDDSHEENPSGVPGRACCTAIAILLPSAC
jgi:hypothetical protein